MYEIDRGRRKGWADNDVVRHGKSSKVKMGSINDAPRSLTERTQKDERAGLLFSPTFETDHSAGKEQQAARAVLRQ